MAETPARADDQHRGQGRHAAGGVHHQAAGKIEHAKPCQPAAAAPHPVADRVVDQQRPKQAEDDKSRETNPLGKGAGDERRGDHREHALVDHEHQVRHRGRVGGAGLGGHPAQPGPGEAADEAAQVRTETERVADPDPLQGHQGDEHQALHDRAERVLAPHHARVEQGQARGHEQHQACRREDEGRIRTVDHRPSNMDIIVIIFSFVQQLLLKVFRKSTPRPARPAALPPEQLPGRMQIGFNFR